MSQKTPQTLLPSVSTQQVIIDPSSDLASSQTLQNMSGRSSTRSSLFGSIPVARSNSMANLRRSSRASSRQQSTDQVPGEQSMAIIPAFDFGIDNWSPSELFEAYGYPLDGAVVGAPDYSTYNLKDNDFQSNSMGQPFPGPWQDRNETAGGLISDDLIDPALLGMPLQPTPGLTAVPGDVSVMQMYPDPTDVYPVQPYYIPPGYHPNPAYPYQIYQQQFPAPLSHPQYMPRVDFTPPVITSKRARSHSDAEPDAPVKKARVSPQPIRNESEDESDGIVVTKRARARQSKQARRESRDSGASSSSSLRKPNVNKVSRIGEKPQICEEKPWIRVNTATKGVTTRTSRINVDYKIARKYKHMPLPHGDWDSSNFTFQYSTHYGIDEFNRKLMKPQQIMEYITQYPSNDLVLWLQVTPADKARRYASELHPKCLFEDCPKHVYKEGGTIEVGHYRVAFDEKSKQHGNKLVDPFDCPGFVHLYCLERFCDFERICQEADVRVDDRIHLPHENKASNWILTGRPEGKIAEHFLAAVQKGKLRKTDMFKYYPVHGSVHESSEELKPFDSTLVRALFETNVANKADSQMIQFTDRKITPGSDIIHLGNMEVALAHKNIMKSKAYQKAVKSKSHFDWLAAYDECDPVINQRMAQMKALNVRLHAERDAKGPRRAKKAQAKVPKCKRVAVEYDSEPEPEFNDHAGSDSEDLEEVGSHTATPPTRSSSRKRQRVNYALDNGDSALPPALPPTHHPQPPQAAIEYPQQPLPAIASSQDPYSGYAPTAQQPPLDPTDIPFSMNQSFNLDAYVRASSIAPSEFTLEAHDKLYGMILERRKSSTAPDTPAPTQAEFDQFMLQWIERRKSSTGTKPALRSPGLPIGERTRQASFNVQPVSRSREFDMDDPPSKVAGRRSGRLASRVGRII